MGLSNYILKRKIKLVQLADIIINDMKITRNDTVIVHVSMAKVRLTDAHPDDLVFLLKMIIGTQGSLFIHETPSYKNESTSNSTLVKAKIIGAGDPLADHNLSEIMNFKSTGKIQGSPEEDEVRVFRKRGIPFFVINTAL